MGTWTDRIKRAGEALLGAHQLDTVNGINKALPAGAVPSGSLSDAADRATGRTPSLAIAAQPAMGDPVDPGPRPIDDLRVMGEPQRWQFPYAYNQTWTPRRYALTPFQTLRMIADVADMCRICIETRKEQIGSLDFDIVTRDGKQSTGATKGIQLAKAAFARPDKKRTFRTWLSMAIEDILVIDALSVYRRKTRKGDHFSWEVKDGATMLPLLDDGGDTPAPPEVAYRQIIYGRPVKGGDTTIDELYYRPRCVRTHTPYGLSPTEAILLTINAALNREMFNLRYYTDGNIPHGLMDAPKDWNKDQIQQFQTYIDEYFSGDLAARRRLKVVANGMSQSVKMMAEPDFTGKYDEWLVKVICAAYAVPPAEVGFTADINKSTSKGQENISYRRGVRPLTGYFEDLFNEMLEFDLGMPEFKAVFSGGESEDELKQAQVDKIYLEMGAKTIDELRIDQGEEPFGGAAAKPFVMTTQGPVFLEDLDGNPILHPNQLDQSERVPAKNPVAEAQLGPDGKPLPAAAAGNNPQAAKDGQPAKGVDKSADVDEDDPITVAAHEDLRRWRTVAVKCVRGGQPMRAFVTEHVPVYLQGQLNRVLRYESSVSGVHKAFDRSIDEYLALKQSRQFVADERSMQKKVKKLVQASLKTLGEDLVEHLNDGQPLEKKAEPQVVIHNHIAPAAVTVNTPDVHVTTPDVHVEPAKVDVAAPVVNVTVEREQQKAVHKRVERDAAGQIIGIVEEPGA
jgi:hypothetical protein